MSTKKHQPSALEPFEGNTLPAQFTVELNDYEAELHLIPVRVEDIRGEDDPAFRVGRVPQFDHWGVDITASANPVMLADCTVTDLVAFVRAGRVVGSWGHGSLGLNWCFVILSFYTFNIHKSCVYINIFCVM